METPVSSEHSELDRIAREALQNAFERFPINESPKLEWRNLRVTAGVAYYRESRIVLSRQVLKNPEDVRETALHEYAHLLAFHRFGKAGAGHGAAWKQAMLDLGLEPKVHHKFEVSRNKSRQEVVYQCKKCGREIIRKRQVKGFRRYIHVNCGGTIKFVGIRSATEQPESS